MGSRPLFLGCIGLLLCFASVVSSEAEFEEHGHQTHHKHSHNPRKHENLEREEHDQHADHQAILGSEKMAHEFDELTPEESKKRLRVLAKKMDKDGDELVTLIELTDWVYHSLIHMDKEETDERFDEIDSNKDNLVTWAEYVQEAFGVEPGQELEKMMNDPDDLKLMNEDRKYFGAADTDRDMALTRQEFASFQNPEHFPHMHDVLVENTLMEKDTNGDGKIDLKEYMGETHEQPTSEWFITEKVRFETEYDKDKDGFLSGEEINAWLIPDLRKTAKQEAEHLIKVADQDRDKELSIDEIVDAHKAFVGSEATSYGEKLMDIPHDEL